MKKFKFQGNEGMIKTYGFKFINKLIVISISETKWHDGTKYKRMPIWFSRIRGTIPTIFIWNVAIAIKSKKKLFKSC